MRKFASGCRLLVLLVLMLGSASAGADSWAPPRTEITLSPNEQSRVTVVPRPLSGALAYFGDKVQGAEPAGQPEGEEQSSPIARVEQLDASGKWRRVWQMPLVNDVGPTSVLLTNDASFLVTFDNWHSAGFGDDVVAIYDHRGKLVRKLALEQILPPAYVHHLPRSVSSRWWGGDDHALVDSDRLVELRIVPPGDSMSGGSKYVSVRIRLADGVVMPPSGKAWERALAMANALESQRLAAWEDLRRLRASLLVSPASRDTKKWRHYMFELRDRIAPEDQMMGGMVLAAPDEDRGFHDADDISGMIERHDDDEKFAWASSILASPTSARLAALLVESLRERADSSMKNAHVVFVGTLSEGKQVIEAAKRSGAKISVVDRSTPFPPGEPLPQTPPPHWMPSPARSR